MKFEIHLFFFLHLHPFHNFHSSSPLFTLKIEILIYKGLSPHSFRRWHSMNSFRVHPNDSPAHAIPSLFEIPNSFALSMSIYCSCATKTNFSVGLGLNINVWYFFLEIICWSSFATSLIFSASRLYCKSAFARTRSRKKFDLIHLNPISSPLLPFISISCHSINGREIKWSKCMYVCAERSTTLIMV